MKCPLFNRVNYTEATELGYDVGDCLKEECAGWDKKLGVCIGVTIALELRLISESLTYLLAKMPHEEQFRR